MELLGLMQRYQAERELIYKDMWSIGAPPSDDQVAALRAYSSLLHNVQNVTFEDYETLKDELNDGEHAH